MRLRVDLKIFVFMFLFFITKQIEVYSIIMFFCIIHELGHVLMGLILGLKPEKIELMPFGLSVAFKLETKDYNTKIKSANLLEVKKIAIALAGPITNLIIILLFLYIPLSFTKDNIIYANLLIMIFNLLPIFPLDGGRALKSIIHIFKGNIKAKKYTNMTANVTLIILTIITSIAILYIHNISILIILGFLWYLVIKENMRYKKLILCYNS